MHCVDNRKIKVKAWHIIIFQLHKGDVLLNALVGLLMVELPSPCQGASLDEKGSVFEVSR